MGSLPGSGPSGVVTRDRVATPQYNKYVAVKCRQEPMKGKHNEFSVSDKL